MSDQKETARLLDANELAEWLNVTPAWVLEAARSGEMPAIKLGRYWRFSKEGIAAWLVERQQRTHTRRTG